MRTKVLQPRALARAIKAATGQVLPPLVLAMPELLTGERKARLEQDMRRAEQAKRLGKERVLVHHPETGARAFLKTSEVLPD